MFGESLKKLRKKHKMSQKELSDVIKVAPSTISMYEKGKRSPNDEILKKIATYFDVSTDFLLGHKRKSNDASDKENDELYTYLETLRNNQEIRTLFELANKADTKQLNAAIEFMKFMENK